MLVTNAIKILYMQQLGVLRVVVPCTQYVAINVLRETTVYVLRLKSELQFVASYMFCISITFCDEYFF